MSVDLKDVGVECFWEVIYRYSVDGYEFMKEFLIIVEIWKVMELLIFVYSLYRSYLGV